MATSWRLNYLLSRCALSMVEFIKVAVDGVEEDPAAIRISIDQEDWFSLEEAATVTTYKWEYGEPLYIRVLKAWRIV